MSNLTKQKDKPPIVLFASMDSATEGLASTLSESGLKVLSCTSVAEGIRFITNQKFDCLILDLNLDDGSADDIILSAKKRAKTLNLSTPVILLSDTITADVLQRLKGMILRAFVKPFNIEEVVLYVIWACKLDRS